MQLNCATSYSFDFILYHNCTITVFVCFIKNDETSRPGASILASYSGGPGFKTRSGKRLCHLHFAALFCVILYIRRLSMRSDDVFFFIMITGPACLWRRKPQLGCKTVALLSTLYDVATWYQKRDLFMLSVFGSNYRCEHLFSLWRTSRQELGRVILMNTLRDAWES
jgi:hypothetical protein